MQKIYIVLAHITLHDQTISEQTEVTILHSNSLSCHDLSVG